jgi:hypothetical protein
MRKTFSKIRELIGRRVKKGENPVRESRYKRVLAGGTALEREENMGPTRVGGKESGQKHGKREQLKGRLFGRHK